MAKIGKRELNAKLDILKELTNNGKLIIRYCNGYYGLFEIWDSCYHKVLGSSGQYDMTSKEMFYYLNGLITGILYVKKGEYNNEKN